MTEQGIDSYGGKDLRKRRLFAFSSLLMYLCHFVCHFVYCEQMFSLSSYQFVDFKCSIDKLGTMTVAFLRLKSNFFTMIQTVKCDSRTRAILTWNIDKSVVAFILF